MAWTKTADFEENDLSDFDSTTGSGLAATAAAKNSGSYGMSVTGATAARYGSFTSLGTVARVESLFYFDPNSTVFAGPVPIAQVKNSGGYGVSQVCVTKPTGSGNYVAFLRGRNMFRANSDSVLENDWWWNSMQYPTLTDAYHGLRLITIIRQAEDAESSYAAFPGGISSIRQYAFSVFTYDSFLFVDDVFSATVSGKYAQELGRLDQLDYGICDTVKTGISGTMYFDDISWAQNEASVAVPMLIRARANSSTVWTNPDTITLVEGSTGSLSLLWEDCGAISSPDAKAYLNMENVTTTLFPTGSDSSSINIQTTPALSGLVGGSDYVIAFQATIDGKTVIRKLRLHCVKPGDEV
jgi:hypothetical protein